MANQESTETYVLVLANESDGENLTSAQKEVLGREYWSNYHATQALAEFERRWGLPLRICLAREPAA